MGRRSCGFLLLLASLAWPCSAEETLGGDGTCQDPAGECTADETPLLQVPAPKSKLSGDKSFSAYVAPVQEPGDPFPGHRNNARVTASFSGGGTRALTVAIGAWRALQALGLEGSFDGVASVSGGSWANAQYMFGKESKETGKELSNTDLVGPKTTPRELTMAFLEKTSSTIGYTGNISTNKEVTKYIAKNTVKCKAVAANNGDAELCKKKAEVSAWQTVYGIVALGYYGLEGAHYLAGSDAHVQNILERNPELKHSKFVTPRTDRPKSYVILGVIDAPVGYVGGVGNIVSFQMSADFTGSPYYPDCKDVSYVKALGEDKSSNLFDLGVTVGGGFVETFAFGGLAPQTGQSGSASPVNVPKPQGKFSLSDAIGISSQAEATAFTKVRALQNLDPTHLYWPVTRGNKKQEAQYFTFGDGGNLDNLGIIPMLQSGAEKIVSFLAASRGITDEVDLCTVSPDYDFTEAATTDFSALFGYFAKDTASYVYSHTQVFPREDYQSVLCGLQSLRNKGRPAVVKKSLTVVENGWWGIAGGNKVEVLFYYLERVEDFVKQLPSDTKSELAKGGNGTFANYPIYKTILQNAPEFTAYYTEQINLLAAQVEYSVRQNAHLYREFLASSNR